ncbi:MAG TPA: hypothetical protein DCS93_38425 [Microscillaceae bacterium]|nr:hypothetical protein [Microscillaceae bacterium]
MKSFILPLIGSFLLLNSPLIAMQTISQGQIEYAIEVVIPGDATISYSREFYRQILRYNIPEKRIVYFDGQQSRTDEVNVDYNYRSLSTTIRTKKSDKYLYLKQYPFFNFYFEIESKLAGTGEYFPSKITFLEEYKDILGYRCQKAKIEEAYQIYYVYFTREVTLKDPTQAVIQHEGIPGVILEQEEIPIAKNVAFYQRYTVKRLEAQRLAPNIFAIPAGYQKLANIDEARQKDRQMLQEAKQKEVKQQPLSGAEQTQFLGSWLLKVDSDSFLVHVAPIKATQDKSVLRFYSYHLTNPDAATRRVFTKEARLAGRQLMVEESPNYNLYNYNAAKNTIELAGNSLFTYERLSPQEVKALKTKYQLDFL